MTGIIAAIMILMLSLIWMNSILDRNIKERTKELEYSNNSLLLLNKKLESTNEQLQTHDRMQQEFITTAAHELRTPIQPILGFSKLIKNKVNDTDLEEFIDIVIKNTNRLKSLAEDILDVTRIEGNKLILKKKTVCIWDLLHSIIKEFEHNLENNNNNKNIKFRLHFKNIDLNSVNVFADKNRLSQVISNLINNSIKFIPKENEHGVVDEIIDIMIEKGKTTGNNLIVSIKDSGKGIDPEIYPRLFTKFASKSFQGTGLGLYISKNIVEAHGGKIWAKNNEDGKGATFSFSLPLSGNHIDSSTIEEDK